MIYQYCLYYLLNVLSMIIMILMLMVGIAYLTLLERKVLSYVQNRKGPNKVGYGGLLQPFSDGMKLFFKEFFLVYKSNYFIYLICPIMFFMMMLMMWMLKKWDTNNYYLNYSLLFMMIILSLMGYLLMMMGWSSNSIYSLVGSIRVISQNLSYEVSFMMIILLLMLVSESYSFVDFLNWQKYYWYLFLLFPLFLVCWVSVLVELNRSPMDFIEGESELVSGFNIEYFSGGFSLIFMAEYGMIIFFMYLLLNMFMNLGVLYFMVWLVIMVLLLIYMRSLLPRMRYDELMMLCWKIILPMILNYFIYIMGFKFLFIMW